MRGGYSGGLAGSSAAAVAEARPDLIIISAGFDAHEDDPLGGLGMSTDDFAALTRDIAELAADCCGGRFISVLRAAIIWMRWALLCWRICLFWQRPDKRF